MEMDLEQIMILLQRRYNALQEINRQTEELMEAVSREDHVSASLMLQIRAEEIERYEACQEKILLLAQEGPEQARVIRDLVLSDAFTGPPPVSFEERCIYELRHRTIKLVNDIRDKDRCLSRRVCGEKSYYCS